MLTKLRLLFRAYAYYYIIIIHLCIHQSYNFISILCVWDKVYSYLPSLLCASDFKLTFLNYVHR